MAHKGHMNTTNGPILYISSELIIQILNKNMYYCCMENKDW